MSNSSSEELEGIKVIDRRRFSTNGTPRDDTDTESSRSTQPAAPPVSSEPDHGVDPRREHREQPGASSTGMDFVTFIASLATNALAALGLRPDAEAQGLPRDHDLAREYIGIISMLQQKTRGNLTAEENQVLQHVLTELRLKFVEVTGQNDARC